MTEREFVVHCLRALHKGAITAEDFFYAQDGDMLFLKLVALQEVTRQALRALGEELE